MEIHELVDSIIAFRDEREWEQFHTPPQLAAALSIEAAELQELFLWKDSEQATHALDKEEIRDAAKREIADVLIYALLFCHAVEADPEEVIKAKLEENANKYPIDLARGKADKYTDL